MEALQASALPLGYATETYQRLCWKSQYWSIVEESALKIYLIRSLKRVKKVILIT
jgi:hypothetical protein